MTGFAGFAPAVMIIWSNRLLSPNSWRVLKLLPVAARRLSRRRYCASAISNLTSCHEQRIAAADVSNYYLANSKYSNIWSATQAMLCREQCFWKRSGICILTLRPTSSMFTSGACVGRSTASRHIRSSTPYAASGFAFVPLLAKTLRSTTFKLALISIGVFGAVVIALFGYVYWSTTTFVLSRSDSVIEAEQAILRNIYDT